MMSENIIYKPKLTDKNFPLFFWGTFDEIFEFLYHEFKDIIIFRLKSLINRNIITFIAIQLIILLAYLKIRRTFPVKFYLDDTLFRHKGVVAAAPTTG